MKYLVYCGPGIGDLILILPMLRRIKMTDPKGHITLFMASDKNRIKIIKQMLCLQEDIDDIDYYCMHEKRHLVEFIIHIGRHRYDWGFSLQYSDNPETSTWPYRIIKKTCKKTCGIKLSYHPEVDYTYNVKRVDGFRIADYPMSMLDIAGVKNVEIDYSTLIDKEKLVQYYPPVLDCLNDKCVSLVVGTAVVGGRLNGQPIKNNTKNWPYQYWIQLSKMLSDYGYKVILLGGKKEEEEISELKLPDNVINLLGKCSILESISVLNSSKIVIGADTGLMHCAGALDIPSLTLFGCTDYREYLPFGNRSYYIASERDCSPCFGTSKALICKNKECMGEITVQQVFDKTKEILSENYHES